MRYRITKTVLEIMKESQDFRRKAETFVLRTNEALKTNSFYHEGILYTINGRNYVFSLDSFINYAENELHVY